MLFEIISLRRYRRVLRPQSGSVKAAHSNLVAVKYYTWCYHLVMAALSHVQPVTRTSPSGCNEESSRQGCNEESFVLFVLMCKGHQIVTCNIISEASLAATADEHSQD